MQELPRMICEGSNALWKYIMAAMPLTTYDLCNAPRAEMQKTNQQPSLQTQELKATVLERTHLS